jgi:succinate-acetate transporter protein
MGFASTTLVLSLFNLNAAHIHAPNVVVGLALFFGGLAQLLAGMWEFAVGNTFGATAFSAYGGFWLSYAAILIPASGITDAYKGDDAELGNALGIYLWSWFIFTLLMTSALFMRVCAAYSRGCSGSRPRAGTSRSSSSCSFSRLPLRFSPLVCPLHQHARVAADVPRAAEMKGSATLTHAGGGLGAIVAFIAYYIALAELLHPDDAWFTLPLGHIRKRAD